MKKLLFVLLAAATLMVTGCKKSDDTNKIEGEWKEKMITTKFAGVVHWISFNKDLGFEMKLSYFTDIAETEPVGCPGNRAAYVKGTYQVTDNKIIFTGNYYDAAFSQQQADCQGGTSFQEQYTFTFKGKDLVLDFEKEDPYKIWLVKQ